MGTDMYRLLQAQDGVASVAQLRSAGVSRHVVDAAVRAKDVTRVRRDALVLTSALAEAPPWERKRLAIKAVGHSLAPVRADSGLALSHGSALRLRRLPCYGDDDLVHLSRVGSGKGRRDGMVWVHAPVASDMVVEAQGVQAVVPALAALQVAATYGLEAGIVALDGVLHEAEVIDARTAHEEGREPDPSRWRRRDPTGRPGPARAEVDRQVAALLDTGFGKMTAAVRTVVARADGRSESTGESRTRWTIDLLGLGPVTPQFAVWDGCTLIGVADLKLDDRLVLVEFDGRTKYAGAHDLFAEKWREDRLRELGYQVVRITWEDLARPHVIRERVLAAIARAR